MLHDGCGADSWRDEHLGPGCRRTKREPFANRSREKSSKSSPRAAESSITVSEYSLAFFQFVSHAFSQNMKIKLSLARELDFGGPVGSVVLVAALVQRFVICVF